MNRTNIHPRGFTTLDVLVGMSIIAILFVVLGIAMSQQAEGHRRLAEQRAAVAFAERSLAAMQAGGAMPAADEDTSVSLRTLPDVESVEGFTWIELTVKHKRGAAVLHGVVRRSVAAERERAVMP